jgi:hypothetical protein
MTTNEDLMSELINKANAAKHLEFRFLRSWREYCNTRKMRRAHELLVSSLHKSTRRQFKNYCKAVYAGETKVISLLAYCTTLKVLQFYEEELCILNDMLNEYEWYLFYGNWIDFILNMKRPENKLFDHRGFTWKNIL